MARSATLYMVLSSDTIFRRVVIPLLLFAASIFRYNVISLLYFVSMLVAILLPAGTRRHLERIPHFILTIFLIVLSTIGTLGQPLFQITLATDYNTTYCTDNEKIWRQCGFVQFEDVNAADITRFMLPDIVILVTSVLSLMLLMFIALSQMWQAASSEQANLSRQQKALLKKDASFASSYHSINSEPSQYFGEASIRSVDLGTHSERKTRRHQLHLVQQPTSSVYFTAAWNFMFIFLLWLSGVCTASVLNFPYFISSLCLALCWGVHLNRTRCFLITQRVIIILVTLYSAVHLILLYVYQLQSAQDLVPRPSVTARVLGLIGLVRTDCDNPTELHVHSKLEWPQYFDPISIVLLYYVTASDVRHWLLLQCVRRLYVGQSVPVEINRKKSTSSRKQATPILMDVEEGATSDFEEVPKKKKSKLRHWFSRDGIAGWLIQSVRGAVLNGVKYFIKTNFVLTLISMMVWSLLFPSWTSFVLLMWSCIVWVTPRFNAKDSVYYTTPLLVIYAIVLLLIQYLYNLDLAEGELESNIYAGLTRYHGPPAGARVLTIAIKSLFTAVFLYSLREFISQYRHQWRYYWDLGVFPFSHFNDDVETQLIPAQSPTNESAGLFPYMKRYWILVTVAAFLLVSLIGDVTIFKMVYMLFFLLFLLCYELIPRYWYNIMKPLWTLLIFYAFAELVFIYTYQFSYVRHKWEELFENHHGSLTPEEILQSIGFIRVKIDSLSFTNVKDLFETLVPPALFVAVMAIQLKYFTPLDEAVEEAMAQNSMNGEGDSNTPKLLQRLIKYLHIFSEFCWRFLEVYLDKIIAVVTFILVLQQVSSTHVITLLILLGPIVGLRATRVWYPLLTLYISVLIMLKMLYQVRMVEVDTFDLTDDCPAIDVIDSHKVPVAGKVFNYKYSPRENDPAWFGFFKVDCQHCGGFIDYITVHIALVMLMACKYSVSRRQARYRRQRGINILDPDKLALFSGISVDEMDKSILKSMAYLVSHVFEFYGLQLCWCVLAINVAVRIDVYGVVYAIMLGLLLLISWKRIWPAWVGYLLVHGCLLVLQYLLLLNTPYGACIQDEREDKKLPWSDVEPLALKRWLWLPLSSDNVSILDKDWLWADFFSFLLICSESYNFRQRSQQPATSVISSHRLTFCTFDQAEVLLDHIKRVVFKHSYWVTIFIILAAGVAQVSILGVVYLVACFFLLWFGSKMQLLHPRKLNHRWFMLLIVVWCVLLVKISLQVRTCVYHKNEFEDDCAITRLFNAQCGARPYYGVTDPDQLCDDLPRHVGLWLDVFAFAAIIIQIILFASPYWSYIRDYTITQHLDDDTNQITDALLNKINTQIKKDRDKEKEMKEKIRERLLAVKKKYNTSVVEHYLRAGVVLPKNIKFIGEDQALYHDRAALVQQGVEQAKEETDSPLPPSIVIDDDDDVDSSEDNKRSIRPGPWRIIGVISELLDNALAMTVHWLRSTCAYYFYIVEQLEAQRSQESRDLHHIPELPSQGPQLVSASTEDPTTAASSSSSEPESIVVTDDSYLLYNKEKVYEIWSRIRHRPMELLVASYYAVLANTQHICYLLIILNVTVNASALSLVYAALMFLWGLLSIPWPTKRFWLTLMVYNMFVILVKYGFQFQQVDWSSSPESGLYWPRVLGVEKKDDFLKNTIWDILLLVSLFFHRHLLQETKRWDIPGYFVVTSYEDTDGTSALKLLFKRRSEISGAKTRRGSQGDDKSNQDQPDYYWDDQDDDDNDDDEDEASENNLIILALKSVLVNVKYFYNQILSPDVSLGAHNYYTLSFIMDCISFIIIAVGFSSFGADEDEGVTAVANYIEENNIPIPFLMMLFAHFLSMVVDRAIYLRKFVTAKLIFYLLQLIVWHLWFFFILPSSPVTDKAFSDNGFSQALYFFKAQYFILSAQQCVSGFPKRVLGYFISKQYNIVASVLFRIYRAIPLLPELKEVMDWMFTPTSLELSHWLKVQEVWSLLYVIKNQRKWEKSDRRTLGDPESFVAKLLMGGGLLILLILLIWGPLLIIALLNTTTISNPPVEVSIQLRIGSFEPLLTMKVGEYGIRRLDDTEFSYVSSDYSRSKKRRKSFEDSYKQSDFRYILFSGNATAVWEISPPARAALQDFLQQNESVYVPLIFSWEITREPETGLASEFVSGEVIRKLYRDNPEDMLTRRSFIKLLQTQNSSPVFLADLFPQYIYAPANGPSTALDVLSRGRYVNCTASLHTRNVTVIPIGATSPVTITLEWWALNQNSSHHAVMDRADNVEFIIYSERINDPEFSFIAGLGIIGLYVSVVLVVGSAIRSYVTRLPSQIIYDEIPNPDSLLELCDDIFYVREDGQLQEEEILVSRLFFTFRSSVRLIEETRWKLD